MKKKLLTILLVFMLIPACFIQAFSNDKFADVSEESWYKESVDYVAEYGLMNGITDDSFAPDKKMSRAMFVTVLGRMANTVGATATSFTDVAADSYYAPYVSWAVENSIVSGTSETTFSPDNNLTREQMAVIITNLLHFPMLRNVRMVQMKKWIIRQDIRTRFMCTPVMFQKHLVLRQFIYRNQSMQSC